MADKLITLQFSIDEDDFEDWLEERQVDEYSFSDWVFGEICQNQGLGFLIGCRIENRK